MSMYKKTFGSQSRNQEKENNSKKINEAWYIVLSLKVDSSANIGGPSTLTADINPNISSDTVETPTVCGDVTQL